MNAMSTRKVCIYHRNCLDGFSAAYIVKKHWESEGLFCTLINADYTDDIGNFPVDEIKGADVYIVDFSYSPDQMRYLQPFANTITMLDHHKSAIDKWGPINNIPDNCTFIFDQGRSGAGLAWDFFYPDEARPYWVDMVEDRDLWKFKFPDTEAFNEVLMGAEQTIRMWEYLTSSTSTTVVRGKQLIEYRNGIIGSIVDSRHMLTFSLNKDPEDEYASDRMILCVNAPYKLASSTADYMLKHFGQDLVATYYVQNDGKIRFSLRGHGALVIASSFGGGGHERAAGFVAGKVVANVVYPK